MFFLVLVVRGAGFLNVNSTISSFMIRIYFLHPRIVMMLFLIRYRCCFMYPLIILMKRIYLFTTEDGDNVYMSISDNNDNDDVLVFASTSCCICLINCLLQLHYIG